MSDERSAASLLLGLLALALVGAAVATPWFDYRYSSGRQTPVGGFHDANETGVVTHQYVAGPAGTSGDARPEDPGAAARVLRWIGAGLAATLALTALACLGETRRASRVLRRGPVLGLQGAAFAALLGTLLLGWFALPEAFGRGVDGPFTSFLADDGYTVTTLRVGWVLAALALPALLGAWLAKFQAGGLDPTDDRELLEALR